MALSEKGNHNSSRTLVVTGASSGIGLETAREAVGRGWRVAIGARGAERLSEVARELRGSGGEVFAQSLDVSDPASVEAFFEASEGTLGPADAIVNNAGHSRPYLLHEYPTEQLIAEIETNVLGAMFVTRRGLKPLLAEGLRGDVVFVSSDAVRNPRPGQLAYGAAKASLENLADGLSKELEGTGIRVIKIRIGPTVSEFGAGWDVADRGRKAQLWRHFALRDARLAGAFLSAEDVARAVLFALEQPPGVVIDTLEIQPEAPKEER